MGGKRVGLAHHLAEDKRDAHLAADIGHAGIDLRHVGAAEFLLEVAAALDGHSMCPSAEMRWYFIAIVFPFIVFKRAQAKISTT